MVKLQTKRLVITVRYTKITKKKWRIMRTFALNSYIFMSQCTGGGTHLSVHPFNLIRSIALCSQLNYFNTTLIHNSWQQKAWQQDMVSCILSANNGIFSFSDGSGKRLARLLEQNKNDKNRRLHSVRICCNHAGFEMQIAELLLP